jgi:hypothetical protein
MRTTVVVTLAAIILLSACTVGEDELGDPEDDVEVIDDADEPAAEPISSVAAGCSANVTCSGTKTCGAWSAYTTCGASFTACHESCGFITRWGCVYKATLSPQNRSRTCVMRATGQTCVEIDYREVVTSCPFSG